MESGLFSRGLCIENTQRTLVTAWGMIWPGESAGKQEWIIITAQWTREISITLDQGHDFEFDAKETE